MMRYVTQWLHLEILTLMSLLILTSGLFITCLMSNFDFFGQSSFLDAAYRVARGQKIYSDFIFTAGPVYPYISALFIKIFHFSKWAIWVHLVVLNLSIIAIAYILVPRTLPLVLRASLIGLCSICFFGPFPDPNYEHHAFLFLLAGIVLSKASLCRDEKLDASIRGFLLGALASLAFFTKAHIGVITVLLFFVALANLKGVLRSFIYLVLGFCFSATIILFSMDSQFHLVEQVFLSGNIISPFADGLKLRVVIAFSPYVPLLCTTVFIGLLGGKEFVRNNRLDFSILMGLVFSSIFSAFAGSANPEMSILILGIEAIFLVAIIEKIPRGLDSASSRILRTAYCAALLMGTVVIWNVWKGVRQELVWTNSSDLSKVTYALTTQQLRGWRSHPEWGMAFDEAVEYIQLHIPENDSIFVFPDSTVIYGLTNHDSYRGAPFQFIRGQIPKEGSTYENFLDRFAQRPPKWIVLHLFAQDDSEEINTISLMKWLHFDSFFRKFYKEVWTSGQFVILKFSCEKTDPLYRKSRQKYCESS